MGSKSGCYIALFSKNYISMWTFSLTLKLSFVKAFIRYSDCMFLTRDSEVYTNPCIHIPVGSNATPSSINPCDLCIVHTHASWTGNYLRIFKFLVFPIFAIGFDDRKIGIQSFDIFGVYKEDNWLDWRSPIFGSWNLIHIMSSLLVFVYAFIVPSAPLKRPSWES